MALVLAVLSSVALGGADFAGGLAAKRHPVVAVVVWSHVAGLTLALVAVATVVPGRPQLADVGWGALAGLASCVGATLLYRALAAGQMMLAAPVAAVAAALLPVVAGLVLGERMRPLALAGIVAALVGVALVSRSGGRARRTMPVAVTVVLAVGAGLGFGAFMVSLAQTSPAGGLWPLVFARCASLTALFTISRIRRTPLRAPLPTLRLGWLSGTLDMASSVLYLLAVREGSLALVGLLASLSPVSTVVLARILLRERTWLWQRLGAGLVMGSVVLLAIA